MSTRLEQENRRLREETLLAFVRAISTDRMVAVTGALSTRALGYPSWSDFFSGTARIALDLAQGIERRRGMDEPRHRRELEIIGEIKAHAEMLLKPTAQPPDPRVIMWKLHDAFRRLDERTKRTRAGLVVGGEYQPLTLEAFEAAVAQMFLARSPRSGDRAGESAPAAVRPLIESLGIKRVATLNFDLELERALMLRQDESGLLRRRTGPEVDDPVDVSSTSGGPSVDQEGDVSKRSVTRFIGSPGSGKPIVRASRHTMSRIMGHGMLVESDIVDRQRPDRLFEFAVGSSETAAHILHLHGRADVPSSLVANIRQYDRLYRLDDLYRDPFDHSLKVLFGGNPVLFVGIGMTEQELNSTLQYYVSNAPVRRPAPMFLIWNTIRVPPAERARFMRERRLDFRRRLGVHVIFEEDLRLPGDVGQQETGPTDVDGERLVGLYALASQAPATLRGVLEPVTALAGMEEEASGDFVAFGRMAAGLQGAFDDIRVPELPLSLEAAEEQALVRTMNALPSLVARFDRMPRHGTAWRRFDRRFLVCHDPPRGHHMWGTLGLARLADDKASDEEVARLRGDDIGARSRVIFAAARPGFGRGELAERLMRMSSRGLTIDRETIRSTEPHNRLLINAGFSYDSDAVLTGIARFLRQRRRYAAAEAVGGEDVSASLPLPELDGSRKQRRIVEPDGFCREEIFASGELFETRDDVLIVINGADRFFGLDGAPLSAELDHMLRCAMQSGRVQFLLLGTDRLRHYCEALGGSLQKISVAPRAVKDRPAPAFETRLQALTGREQDCLRSSYLDWIARCFMDRAVWSKNNPQASRGDLEIGNESKVHIGRKPRFPDDFDISEAAARHLSDTRRTHPEQITRAFYDAYLSPALLRALQVDCPATFEVLRTMSFIGAPVEAAVLLHAPKVRAILGETDEGTDQRSEDDLRRRLGAVMRDLHVLGLVIAIGPHGGSGFPERDEASEPRGSEIGETPPVDAFLRIRFGLHRSLTAYLRDRHGVPINDAKLATTFNMSLFTSEPGDNYSPQPGFHDELGDLVDDLVGAWHDLGPSSQDGDAFALSGDERSAVSEQDLQPISLHPDDAEEARRSLEARSSRIASGCLRAALSLVRGYYSTTSLLKFDREDHLAQPDRDGALTEHAQRLDRIMRGFAATAAARDIVRKKTRDNDERLQPILKHLGPEPFYEDDLVWLQNERGVVALAQGHLFDAVRAFRDAERTNSLIEPNYRGHNWRRISLNLVATLIERADLKPAERLLDQIEETINSPAWLSRDGEVGRRRLDEIRDLLRKSDTPPVRGDRMHTREEFLVTALVTGYRGLIAQIRGRYHDARASYVSSTDMLRRLGEQRAFAHFQRHYAALQSFIGDKDSARQEIEYALAAAVAARQMDIVHRCSVVRADILHSVSTDVTVRRNALEDVKRALRYSTGSDCYRVRIEASASLARHMRHGGDYDAALRYAADALTIASRYGHSLQKTALRIEIGRILQQRGDPRSGKALLDKAIEIGSGKGHQQALERVRRADSDDGPTPAPSNRVDSAAPL